MFAARPLNLLQSDTDHQVGSMSIIVKQTGLHDDRWRWRTTEWHRTTSLVMVMTLCLPVSHKSHVRPTVVIGPRRAVLCPRSYWTAVDDCMVSSVAATIWPCSSPCYWMICDSWEAESLFTIGLSFIFIIYSCQPAVSYANVATWRHGPRFLAFHCLVWLTYNSALLSESTYVPLS